MQTCSRCKKDHRELLKTCLKCRTDAKEWKNKNKTACALVLRLWKQKNWARRMVCHAMETDTKRNRLPHDMTLFVEPTYLERLRLHQHNECAYCGIEMQTQNRKLPDGLTLQRLNNAKGHTTANCILACFECNCRRVERCNKAFLDEKKRNVYFHKLVRGGYQTQHKRINSIL